MNDAARGHLDLLIKQYPVLGECMGQVAEATELVIACFERGGKVLICGNGGSAADSGHISGELLKGFLLRRPVPQALRAALGDELADRLQCGLPAVDLTCNGAIISAAANDLGADVAYAQQVLALGRAGDVLLGISTSGNAANVANALAVARVMGMGSIALTGRAGGRAAGLADVAIRVPADETWRVQEYHLPLYHAVCAAVEAHFFAQ